MKPMPATYACLEPARVSALPDARRFGELWFGALCIALGGYAVAGKGFAYVGVPPLFVGEMLAVAGMAVIMTSRSLGSVMRMPAAWLMTLLCVWCTLRTLPYVGEYKIDALRDLVIVGYAVFAFAVAAVVIGSPRLLSLAVVRYRALAKVFLCLVPIIFVVEHLFEGLMPTWPWADTPIVHAKGGDVMVHCAGITAFWIAGFAGATSGWWLTPLLVLAPMAGIKNRGGLLSFLMVFAIVLAARPGNVWTRRLIVAGLCAMLAAAISNVSVKLPGEPRPVSVWQFAENIQSMFMSSGMNDLDATKAWRLNWWGDIVDYTLGGSYFWSGKGFGVNLADADGYQVLKDGSLRSPHNGHLTILARAGVPGAVLWLATHVTWALMMLGRWWLAERTGQVRWAGLFMFLLVYWMAFMSNAMFDVFLEGPMGGIWFWSLFGLGLAATWLHKHQPEVLTEG